MLRQTIRWLGARPVHQQVLIGGTITIVGSEVLAPSIWYLLAGEVPWVVHVVTILTAAIIALPMWSLFVAISNLLGQSEEMAARAKRASQRKSEIFRTLLRVSLDMHRSDELSPLLHGMLGHLGALFPATGFAVIIDGARPGTVRHIAAQGLGYVERQILIEHNDVLLGPQSVHAVAALREAADPGVGPDGPDQQWNFLPLHGREGRPLGKLVARGPALDEEAREIISLFLEQLSTATENKLLSQELEKLASTDGLTGAYNRAYFRQELDRHVRMKRENPAVDFCLVLVDLNSLKRVNDDFGHTEGDRTIVALSRLMVRSSRREDLVCRIGGDEFVILCPGTTTEQVMPLVERIRQAAERTVLEHPRERGGSDRLALSVSIGVACSSEMPPEQVFKAADDRMYAAKDDFYRRSAGSAEG